uniref:Uncharacterized protein n=1 Tax=Caenorhabditis japonica TaxID=281687 RepID=A0A8R1DGR0_CAEJA
MSNHTTDEIDPEINYLLFESSSTESSANDSFTLLDGDIFESYSNVTEEDTARNGTFFEISNLFHYLNRHNIKPNNLAMYIDGIENVPEDEVPKSLHRDLPKYTYQKYQAPN